MSTECNYDKLVVSDGVDELVLCGLQTGERIFLTDTLVLTFTTDGTTEHQGFHASYQILEVAGRYTLYNNGVSCTVNSLPDFLYS